jgi:ATP-dependent Clp protease ATP-binding subunit ClpB
MTEGGAVHEEIEVHVKDLLKQHLRPELINRIDDTVIFHQLGREQLKGIVGIQVDLVRQRLVDRGLGLEIDADAMHALAAEGFDPQFGARPLKRVIQQRIENPIATRILSGAYEEGDTILVSISGEQFGFDRRSAPPSDSGPEVVEAELVED